MGPPLGLFSGDRRWRLCGRGSLNYRDCRVYQDFVLRCFLRQCDDQLVILRFKFETCPLAFSDDVSSTAMSDVSSCWGCSISCRPEKTVDLPGLGLLSCNSTCRRRSLSLRNVALFCPRLEIAGSWITETKREGDDHRGTFLQNFLPQGSSNGETRENPKNEVYAQYCGILALLQDL